MAWHETKLTACAVVVVCVACGHDALDLTLVAPVRPAAWAVVPQALVLAVGDSAHLRVTVLGRGLDTLDLSGTPVEGHLELSLSSVPYQPNPPAQVWVAEGSDRSNPILLIVAAVEPGTAELLLRWGYNDCDRAQNPDGCYPWGYGQWLDLVNPLIVPIAVK